MGLRQTIKDEWRKTDKPRPTATAKRLAQVEQVLDRLYGHNRK